LLKNSKNFLKKISKKKFPKKNVPIYTSWLYRFLPWFFAEIQTAFWKTPDLQFSLNFSNRSLKNSDFSASFVLKNKNSQNSLIDWKSPRDKNAWSPIIYRFFLYFFFWIFRLFLFDFLPFLCDYWCINFFVFFL